MDNEPMRRFSLQGRTALVTGGTQGVGAAICQALAAAGANLLIHGLRQDAASEATLAACRAFGGEADLLLADLAEPGPAAAVRLGDEARARRPELDLLVNNAGTYIDQPFLEMEAERFEKTMQLNVHAPFYLTQRLTRRWVAEGTAGRVLFTGSINGQLSEADHVAYDASKGAIGAMVRSLCVALAPHRIRVNALAPGLVRTPLTAPAIDDPAFGAWMRLHTPSGEVPDAEVCGETAVFLLSEAARHIHGQTLLVDGGMSVWQQPDLPAELRDAVERLPEARSGN